MAICLQTKLRGFVEDDEHTVETTYRMWAKDLTLRQPVNSDITPPSSAPPCSRLGARACPDGAGDKADVVQSPADSWRTGTPSSAPSPCSDVIGRSAADESPASTPAGLERRFEESLLLSPAADAGEGCIGLGFLLARNRRGV